MAKHIVIMRHSRGNHSPFQVRYYGKKVFEGNAKEAKEYMRECVRRLKKNYCEVSTDDTLTEYVNYQMADLFAVDMSDGEPKWFIWR